jgi:HK97 family phage portal protein
MLKWLTKAFNGSVRHAPHAPSWQGLLRRTRFDYRKEIGGGFDASVVTAPVHWLQRALPEARLTVKRYRSGGQVDELGDHKMLDLIRRPNDYYGDIALWSATIWSWCTDGNAYWLKERSGIGRPAELWYVPHWAMEPVGSRDGSEFLSHYLYSPGGGHRPMEIDPDDVVHFRHGLDPRNPRKGLSPIDGAIREIFMDLESSNFVASLLRNMGVPGVVISPKTGGVVGADDVQATKAWFQEAFGGDRRGGPLVMGAPTDVSPYGFNPQQMNMSEARDVAEERICACLGVSPAVVGFGAGLQSTKVGATMMELRKLAWHNGVLPMGRAFADELDRSLLPDFGDTAGMETAWDTGDVQAMQDDRNQAATRWNTMIQGGWAMLAEGREAMGLEVDESHRIYLRPAMALETPASPQRPVKARIGIKARASREQRLAARGYVMALQRQEETLAPPRCRSSKRRTFRRRRSRTTSWWGASSSRWGSMPTGPPSSVSTRRTISRSRGK